MLIGRPLLALVLGCALLAGASPSAAAAPRGVWPLPPVPAVVRGFDPPTQPWESGHRGVDLGAVAGTGVRAALPGRVSFAARVAGRGVVVVDHGRTRTTYEPVAAEVAPGDRVDAGDRIGVLELLGSHCLPGACLHWGWLRGEVYLDPLILLGARPVRLLPLTEPAEPAHRSPAGPVVAPGQGTAPWWAVLGAQARGWACW